jgi:hypothetical protein
MWLNGWLGEGNSDFDAVFNLQADDQSRVWDVVNAFARLYLMTCVIGTIACFGIVVVMAQAGYTPHLHLVCQTEISSLVRVLSRATNLLACAVAGLSLIYAAKQMFVAPKNAVRPLIRMAVVLGVGFFLPFMFGVLSQIASGTQPVKSCSGPNNLPL